MTALVLDLHKEGEQSPVLSLNLSKGEGFKVRLMWEGDTDLDLHAIVCTNLGQGAKASSMADILSAYNVVRQIAGKTLGSLQPNADGSFEVYGGALKHSPDARNGDQSDVDEWIDIDPVRLTRSKVVPPTNGVIEIPLLAMIHPQHGGLRFGDVKNASVVIENLDGEILLNISLSSQFADFVGVQMGAIQIGDNGSSFHSIGVGFNGDFNTVLAHFS